MAEGRGSKRGGLVLLPLALLLTAPRPASAQEADARTRVWLGMGLAAGGVAGIDAPLGLLARVTWQREPHQATLRLLYLGESEGFPETTSSNHVTELGLLYGRSRVSSWGHAALSAGASLLAFESYCPHVDRDGCVTVGVPFTAEAAVQGAFVGLGLQAFGNINPRAPYGGVAVFVQLGWMP